MATHVKVNPQGVCTIKPADHELLHSALENWYDKAVLTDEHVGQVTIAGRAFQRWLIETAWAKQHDPVACVLCLHSDSRCAPC